MGDTRRAVRAIEKKAHKPTRDVLGVGKRKAGYADRGERHHKLRRAEKLRARHVRIASEIESGTVRLVRGGKQLLKNRVHLQEAGRSEGEWRERWEAARTFFSADGESGKPLGNESVRVYPSGVVEVRLPSPLKHFANMLGCRYRLDGTAEFSYRAERVASACIGRQGGRLQGLVRTG